MTPLQADQSVLWNAAAGVVVPAVVAGTILAAAERAWRAATGDRSTTAWGPPVAIGVSFAAGYAVTQGWPLLSSDLGIKQWLFHAGLAGAFFGAYEALAERRVRLGRTLLSIAAPLLLLSFMRKYHWTGSQAILWTGGLGGILFASWISLEALVRRPGSAAVCLGWALTVALGALAQHLSGSTSLGLLEGALVPALAGCALLAFLRPGFPLALGVAPFILLHSGLAWAGHFASELGTASFALLLLAPLTAWVGQRLPESRARLRALATGAGPALAALAALLVEWATAPASP